MRTSRSASVVAVEAVEVAAQGLQVADRHVRRHVGDHVGHPAQRGLGPEQLAEPAPSDVADQPAEQPPALGRLQVVGRQLGHGRTDVGVGRSLFFCFGGIDLDELHAPDLRTVPSRHLGGSSSTSP